MDMIDMSYIYYMRPQYEPIALSSRSQNPWKALTKPDTIQGTFSGANSYWFGDERSYMNAKGTSLGLVDLIENHEDELREQIELIEEKIPSAIGLTAQSSTEKAKSDVDKKLKQLKKKSEKIAKSWERKGNRLVKNGQKAGDVFDLTFENGAQWSYLGIPVISDQDLMKTLAVIVAKANEGLDFSELKDFGMVESIQKRISSITLRDGGIINIDDDDLHQTWAKLGLTQEFADVGINLEELTDHNYVRIGNLKGDNGIFRLDLNGRDKYKSDMIFIESAQLATAKNKNSQDSSTTEVKTFYLDSLNPLYLTEINENNTLRFATVSNDAKVAFADSFIYGTGLYDYTLNVASTAHKVDDISNIPYEDRLIEEDDKFLTEFNTEDRTDWYIKNVTTSLSATTEAMTDAGFAAYNSIVYLDRYDSRNTEVSRYAGEKEGIWVRIKYGQDETKHRYSGDYVRATVGFDHYLSEDNRLGIGLTYVYGDYDFDNVNGSTELNGYEAMIYDTQYFDDQYLDFVLRFGNFDNDFEATNIKGYGIDTDYDQKYVAFSAEYGRRFTTNDGAFLEPQIQFQLAYLDEADYEGQRGISADLDSTLSAIGRIGVRGGNSWKLENGFTNDLYARVDLLHEFTDGQDAVYTDGIETYETTFGNRSTWCEFGVGGILHWDNGLSMSLDVSKSVGSNYMDTWEVNGLVRYIF